MTPPVVLIRQVPTQESTKERVRYYNNCWRSCLFGVWMACRHHSMELKIAVGYITIFSPSTGPEVTLFKGLQEVWNSLDPTDIDLPTLPPSLKQQKADLLRFVNSKLSYPGSTPQDDYKEFLELAKLYMGGTVSRKKVYKLQRPGADHQARWMLNTTYIPLDGKNTENGSVCCFRLPHGSTLRG